MPRLLQRARAEVDLETEVVVVDNGSRDGSVELVREQFPDVRLVTLSLNEGFAGGVSRGIAAARGEWISVFNNDTTLEPQALTVMLEAARSDRTVGAVAAQMRFADRRDALNSAGLEIDRLGVAADRLVGSPVYAKVGSQRREVFGATGGGGPFRRQMLDDVGGFDETFFAFVEELDLAWRGRAFGWGRSTPPTPSSTTTIPPPRGTALRPSSTWSGGIGSAP